MSQLATVSAGQAAPKDDEFSDDGIPFIRAGSLDSLLSGKSESDLELVGNETAKLRKLKTYPKGTILFAKSGMSAAKDRIYVLQNPAYVVSHLATLIPNGDAHSDYLRLALKRFPPSVLIKDPAYPAISLGDIQSYEIPVPEQHDDQLRIAHLLGKVEGLIAQRKQHLQQLDDLLKSVFLAMFGDIRKQESPHPFVALRPYLKANSGKSSKGVQAADKTDIPIFGGNGINGWSTKALYEEPVVIAGRVGQQCGVIHTSEGPCWVTDNAIVLSIQDGSLLNIQYLATAFQHAPIRQKVQQLDLPFINQAMLLDYPLPLPPIELQNQFSVILKKVGAIKRCYQQSLAELQALYGALSQQAFKGELDLSRVPLPVVPTEGEQNVAADSLPIQATETAIHLPETDLILAALESREHLKELLHEWLEAYRGQSGAAILSIDRFMDAVQTRLAELHPDNDFELGQDGYDHIKTWVFDALASGKLKQNYDDAGNRIQLKAAQA